MTSAAETKTVQIALVADENYVPGLQVTAASIARYAGREVPLHFHILDGGISDAGFQGLVARVSGLHASTIVSRYRVNEAQFRGFPAWGGNRMVYARLLLPELLGALDHVIYCDADVLWLAPIEDLWALRQAGVIAQVCRDGGADTVRTENEWFRKKGYPMPGEGYFCAGIMLLNLELFRSGRIVEKVCRFIEENPDVKFLEQTALNAILSGKVQLISQQWHTLTIQVRTGPLELPVVWHYADEAPWTRKARWELLTDTVMLWHWFNDRVILKKRNVSVRMYYTFTERLYKRGLFLCLTNTIFRGAFYQFLRWMNRKEIIPYLERYNHKIQRNAMCRLVDEWSA
jgi:lipopolysaccharide biosynthesis glycosyltransferase